MIIRRNGEYLVVSHDGKKILSRPYATRPEAVARLQQIETFKLRPRWRRPKRNPIGKNFATGLALGAVGIGAIWGLLTYFNKKTVPVGCQLCLQADSGTVPPGVTGAVTGTYKGIAYSTYFIDNDATLAWGWMYRTAPDKSEANWGFATQALADADAKKQMDLV